MSCARSGPRAQPHSSVESLPPPPKKQRACFAAASAATGLPLPLKSSFTLKKCFRLSLTLGIRTADPRLVKRIVEDASWADVDWIQHLWAGLFVGTRFVGYPDQSNLPFIHKLSQLATAHARIFVAACSRTKKIDVGTRRGLCRSQLQRRRTDAHCRKPRSDKDRSRSGTSR